MKQESLVAACCLVCAAVCWKSFLAFEGTEFGSGSLAGNQIFASLLFVAALVLTFKYPRSAAVSALVACVLSLPLYLYLVFPRPFRRVWPGQWKVRELPSQAFVWDGWWTAGILSVGFAACVGSLILVRSLTSRKPLELGN